MCFDEIYGVWGGQRSNGTGDRFQNALFEGHSGRDLRPRCSGGGARPWRRTTTDQRDAIFAVAYEPHRGVNSLQTARDSNCAGEAADKVPRLLICSQIHTSPCQTENILSDPININSRNTTRPVRTTASHAAGNSPKFRSRPIPGEGRPPPTSRLVLKGLSGDTAASEEART